MNKRAFVEQLRETADIPQPLTSPPSAGAKHWDGTVNVGREPALFYPYALA